MFETNLDLSGKSIGSYDLTEALNNASSELKVFDISETSIDDISFLDEFYAKFQQLIEINVSSTLITDLTPLSGFKQLQVLYANNLNLVNIDIVSELPNLKKIYLENSNIKNLVSLSQLANLEILNLGENPEIIDISPLSNLKNLKELYLQNTAIYFKKQLDPIREMRFNQLGVNEELESSAELLVSSIKKIPLNENGFFSKEESNAMLNPIENQIPEIDETISTIKSLKTFNINDLMPIDVDIDQKKSTKNTEFESAEDFMLENTNNRQGFFQTSNVSNEILQNKKKRKLEIFESIQPIIKQDNFDKKKRITKNIFPASSFMFGDSEEVKINTKTANTQVQQILTINQDKKEKNINIPVDFVQPFNRIFSKARIEKINEQLVNVIFSDLRDMKTCVNALLKRDIANRSISGWSRKIYVVQLTTIELEALRQNKIEPKNYSATGFAVYSKNYNKYGFLSAFEEKVNDAYEFIKRDEEYDGLKKLMGTIKQTSLPLKKY